MGQLFQELSNYIQSHPLPVIPEPEGQGSLWMPTVVMGDPRLVVLVQILKERNESFECCIRDFKVTNSQLKHHNGMGTFFYLLRSEEGACLNIQGPVSKQDMVNQKTQFLEGLTKDREKGIYPFDRVILSADEEIQLKENERVGHHEYVFGELDAIITSPYLEWKADFDAFCMEKMLEPRSTIPALRI